MELIKSVCMHTDLNFLTHINNGDFMKKKALAKFLGCEQAEIEQTQHDENTFEYGNQEYLVLTDKEADEKAKEDIENSIWAFKAEFIVEECGLDYDFAECIQAYQEKKCDDANDVLKKLVEKMCGLDEFVQSAISSDGRGHFLATYDGDENEEGKYFIYRVN